MLQKVSHIHILFVLLLLACQTVKAEVLDVSSDSTLSPLVETDTLGAKTEEEETESAELRRPFTIDDFADDVDIFAEAYMQPDYADPIIEIGTTVLYPTYSINPTLENHIDFTTGPQTFLTANVNWKWLRVGWSQPLADYTHGYDFSFSPRIAHFLIDLGISKIRNYKVLNPGRYAEKIGENVDDIQLDGLETFEWKCNLEWIMNPTYFSASSAFSQSYSCGQRVSAGSVLCGVAFGENRFSLNPSEGRSEKANEILSQLPMQDNRILNASLGCGYGYNFVVRQGKFVIGTLLIPYLTGARSSYQLAGRDEVHFCYGLRSHSRVNCVYQHKYGFILLSTNWRNIFLYDNGFSYMQNNFYLDLGFSLKLGMIGIHHEKVPGHQIIDFIDKIF